MVTIKTRVPGLSEPTLARFVSRAKRTAKLRGEVNVLVTSDRELRRLNQRFRGKDQPTDVLSFPAVSLGGNALAGDIAISAQLANENAQRFGHSMAKEVKILALHGILHLAGCDHEKDHGEMAAREARLRSALGLPLGLIERSGQRSPESTRRSGQPRKFKSSSKSSR